MRLIANKPCSFGGQQFYIGDEIPGSLVADAKTQEKFGVVTIVDGGMGVPGGQPGALFTQAQVENMIAKAVAEAEKKREVQLAELQEHTAELEARFAAYGGTVPVAVKNAADGQFMTIPARPKEIQQVFAIMQMAVADGAEAIAGVESENVLILLHAADSRKMIKKAAKEQADTLFPARALPNESGNGNETIDANTEGDDA